MTERAWPDETVWHQLPIGAWFRFRHYPDDGPYRKTGERTYVLAVPVEKRCQSSMTPVEIVPVPTGDALTEAERATVVGLATVVAKVLRQS